MKPFRLILLSFLIASCATTPRLSTYEGSKVASGKGVIVNCELLTGERFDFDYPGAHLVTMKNIIFGKKENFDFVAIVYDSTYCLYDESRQRIPKPDRLTAIDSMVSRSGQTVIFKSPGGFYYDEGLFISGKTMNGTQVYIPVDRVVQSENLRNFKQLQNTKGFLTMLFVAGSLGLLVLYTTAKVQEGQ